MMVFSICSFAVKDNGIGCITTKGMVHSKRSESKPESQARVAATVRELIG